ncbi:NADH dehydrogenase (ubiquinone) complex I, assembly factor 6-like [Ylistrum balloti]|uniref:NADH dehydrogenase (ubiquinone) complex I, assembly factor 6-like n=1 Tax=Ylistrum balloti TaxID=509963 RepID=UPI002905A84C|nr:NADH dehydrogenase (ubiquinone) complex I, assembly factor 6-like [Ylistrum balloti]
MATITKTYRGTWSFLSYIRRNEKRNAVLTRARNTEPSQQLRFCSSRGTINTSNRQYCLDLIQKFDHENFLCTLLYSKSAREAAIAIRAFNVEIAQVQDVVSDKQRGAMRMVFWRDTIEKIYQGSPPQQPIALQLAKVISENKLTKKWFMRCIDARADCLENDSFRSINDLEDYCENSVSSVMYLILESLGIKDLHADHAASHIGRAHGLVTFLRAIPFNTSRGRINLPTELLIKYNVSQEDVYRGKKPDLVNDIVYDIASVANQHLRTARSLKKDVPKSAVPTFLNTVICEKYLTNIQQAGFNVFDTKLQRRNGLLPLQLLMQSMKKTY